MTILIKSKLLKDTFLYSIINIIDKVIPFIIIPILTRVISKEGIGYYTLYQSLLNILIPFLTLSIDNAILVKYFKINKYSFAKYFSTGIFLALVIYVFGAFLGYIFSPGISKLFGLPLEWVQITMVIVLLQFFSVLRKNIWRVKREAFNYGSYSIPLTLSKNILGLILVFYTPLGWKGIILGHFIAQLFFSAYAIKSFISESYFIKYLNKIYIIDLLRFGIPISIHKMGLWLSNALNKIIINSVIGLAATGSYGVAAVFGIIITVIGDAVTKAYVPFLYEKLSDFNEKTSLQLVKLIYGYYFFYFSLLIIVSVFGYFGVGIIFGADYEDTKNLIFPIVLASTLNAFYKIHVDFISFSSKTHLIASVTLSTGILNGLIAYLFVSYFGIIGAAYSSVLIQFITYIFILYLSNRQFRLPWLFFISKK